MREVSRWMEEEGRLGKEQGLDGWEKRRAQREACLQGGSGSRFTTPQPLILILSKQPKAAPCSMNLMPKHPTLTCVCSWVFPNKLKGISWNSPFPMSAHHYHNS